jgi:hypothetical protein
MDKFLRCLCDEEYTALGTGTPAQLEEAWLDILTQYYEAKGESIRAIEQLNLSCQVLRLQQHLRLLQICIDVLSTRYSESIADSLNKLGYVFKPASKKPEDYRNILQVIANKSKTKYIQLKQLTVELQKKQKEISELSLTPTREAYEERLLNIEEMQKVSYSMELITVAKFITLEKKYIKRMELLEAKQQKWQQTRR